MFWFLWSAVPTWAAPVDCDAAVEKSALSTLLDEAEGAVAALDPQALAESMVRTRLLFRCVEEPLEPAEIARLFRLSGISRYVEQDLVGAVADFELARGIEPDAQIDDTLGPPLRITYDAVPPPSGERVDLPRPAEGTLQVDGKPDETAPADRPYLVQWLADDGGVRGTWLVEEGAQAAYPAKGTPTSTKGKRPTGGGKGGKPLFVVGLASGAVAVGGMVGAALIERSFVQSEQPSSALSGQVTANRVLGYGGIGLGVVGVGLVGTSLVVEF